MAASTTSSRWCCRPALCPSSCCWQRVAVASSWPCPPQTHRQSAAPRSGRQTHLHTNGNVNAWRKEGRKEMFYLMTHSAHFIHGCMEGRKEGNVLFNDTLGTLYSWLYGRKEGNVLFNDTLGTLYSWLYFRHVVKDHSDSEKGNLLLPHGLLFLINSKGSFICIIPQTGLHISLPLLHQLWSTGWNENEWMNV